MPAMQSGSRIETIARQWHDLAERRLAHYQELYRSGRWTRYYLDRDRFVLRMLDVIAAAKAFRKLAGRAAPSTLEFPAPPPSPRHDDFPTAA